MLDLNQQQIRAASHLEGPMLVLAGPGTGKTETLVGRFVFLMSRGVPPGRILAVTFTRKAATSLKARIARSTGLEMKNIMAGTFHALALTLATEAPSAFPKLAGRKLADEKVTDVILKRVLRDVPMDPEEASLLISGYKDQLITPQKQLERALKIEGPRRLAMESLANAYIAYQERLDQDGFYDFADLIGGVIDGLDQDPALARRLSQRFSHVMVDEYQDINLAQHKFIEKLLSAHRNIWAVGDDDQALYGWRSADVRFILDFEKNYPGARVARLELNYRSQQNILTFAGGIIIHNSNRFAKHFAPTRDAMNPVRIHIAANVDDEAQWVAARIHEIRSRGEPLSSIAILSRVGYHLGAVERALNSSGLPVQVIGATPFWTSSAVTLFIGLYNALQPRTVLPEVADKPPRWLLTTLQERRRSAEFLPLAKMIIAELYENPPKKQAIDEERKAAWRQTLDQLLAEIEATGSAEGIATKINATQNAAATTEHITACTIHASKGLEWKHVFLIAMEDGVIPHRRSDDLEEERRLAYVGATRAGDELYITMARERAKRETKPSRFIDEGAEGAGRNVIKVTKA